MTSCVRSHQQEDSIQGRGFRAHDKLADIVIPNQRDAKKTNSAESIQGQVDLCEGKWSKTPNVVLVSASSTLYTES